MNFNHPRNKPTGLPLTPIAKSCLILCATFCIALSNSAVHADPILTADSNAAGAAAGADSGPPPTPENTFAAPDAAIDAVMILGQRATTENAIKAQQSAPNIINMLTADEIRKLPDVNVAEAVARLPGISLETDTGEGRFINIRGLDSDLNSTTFAGLRLPPSNPASPQGSGRAVALDAIPNGLVGSITVTKTNLPEQDAEALGGTIEISPKTAPLNGKPFFDGHLGSGYEDLRGTGIADVSVSMGTRFGGDGGPAGNAGNVPAYSDHPFSVVFTAAYYADRRGIDDLEEAYMDDGVHPANSLQDIDIRRYQYDRKRHGVGLDLGFQPDANNSYYIRGFDAGYTEAKITDHLTITTDGNPVAAPGGGFTDGVEANGFDQFVTNEKEKIDNQVFMAGGQNKFAGDVLDYRLGYTKGSYDQFYDQKSDFNYTPPAGTITYNNTGPGSVPQFTVSGADYLNPGNYSLVKYNNQTQETTDSEWSFATNFKMPVNWGSFDQENVKVGLDTRIRTRNSINPEYSYKGVPGIPLTDASSGGNVTMYNGMYQILPLIDTAAMSNLAAPYEKITAGNIQQSEQTYQHDTENVNAAYWQYQMKSGKLGVIGGLRVENTNAKYSANVDDTDAAGNDTYTPVTNTRDYTNAFPSAQARYELEQDALVRASFSSTIARPGFQQINPAVVVSDSDNTISTGNPNLKPTTANSFDLSYEKYLAHGGIFSLGIFDKQIKNYIVATNYNQYFQATNTQYAGLSGETAISSWANTSSGFARGVEVNYMQKFKELPDFWSGFGVDVNFTLNDSGTEIHPGTTSMLPSTSRNNGNLEVFYEHDALELRLGANYVSSSLWAIGGNANTPDTYAATRLQVDFGGSYTVNNNYSIYFAAKNMTNTPLKFYEGTPDRPIQREFYGPTFLAGVNFKY